MKRKEGLELHSMIKKLRLERGFTQKYVAEYLGVDVSTYAHYEAARRTPNIEKLRLLAELYGLKDELLGVEFLIVARTEYPQDLLDNLENVIKRCPKSTGDFYRDMDAFRTLKNALQPVMEIRDNALDLPNIDVQNICP